MVLYKTLQKGGCVSNPASSALQQHRAASPTVHTERGTAQRVALEFYAVQCRKGLFIIPCFVSLLWRVPSGGVSLICINRSCCCAAFFYMLGSELVGFYSLFHREHRYSFFLTHGPIHQAGALNLWLIGISSEHCGVMRLVYVMGFDV